MSTHNPDSPTPRRPALRWPKTLVLIAAGLCFAFSAAPTTQTPEVIGSQLLQPSTDLEEPDGDRYLKLHDPELATARYARSARSQITCARCYDRGTDEDPEHFATLNFPVLEGWHGNPDEEGADEEWGTHYDNLPGTCEENHDECIGGDQFTAREITERTIDAVARGEIGQLAHLLNSPRVSLVTDRSALQVLGCDYRTIAAHVPIDERLLAALATVAADQDRS